VGLFGRVSLRKGGKEDIDPEVVLTEVKKADVKDLFSDSTRLVIFFGKLKEKPSDGWILFLENQGDKATINKSLVTGFQLIK